jgi:uncharacterized protein (UPF0297 family)
VVLTDDQIKELVLHPANEKLIARGSELYDQHARHVKGIGVEEFFIKEELKGYENEEDKILRRKMSRASTVPIYASALGTFDKAYTASGKSRYFEFKSDKDKKQSKDLEMYLNTNVAEGQGMDSWMKSKWGDKIHYDFNGVMMVELPKIDPNQSQGKRNQPYVIFKSIHDIHDYKYCGINIDYLILKTCYTDQDKAVYYRVIDDKRDLIVRVWNKVPEILDTPEYPIINNIWGYVPAVCISNQSDATTEAHQSFIWQSCGVADDYLLDSSIHSISKKKHGFPQKWSYAIPCKVCDSKGKLPVYGELQPGETGQRPVTSYYTCKTCNGHTSIPVSPSMVVLKPLPDAANPDVGEPFGYVTPDNDTISMQVSELERLEDGIHDAIWSVLDINTGDTGSSQTATGRVLDVSPKQTKLEKFSANGESVEQFLTDAIGKAIYPDTFVSSIVKWGRKYFILTENHLEETIRKAKDAGVNSAIMRSYMEELIYVRYATDHVELSRQLKLFQCEPFVHLTVKDVQELKYASDFDKYLKTYFNDFVEEIEANKPETILLGTVDQITTELHALTKQKMIDAGAVDANGNPVSTDKEADARAQLRGSVGGVQAMIDLVTRVQTGFPVEQAIAILVTTYGYTDQQARDIIGVEPEKINPPDPTIIE